MASAPLVQQQSNNPNLKNPSHRSDSLLFHGGDTGFDSRTGRQLFSRIFFNT